MQRGRIILSCTWEVCPVGQMDAVGHRSVKRPIPRGMDERSARCAQQLLCPVQGWPLGRLLRRHGRQPINLGRIEHNGQEHPRPFEWVVFLDPPALRIAQQVAERIRFVVRFAEFLVQD